MVFEPNPYSVLIVSSGGRLRENLSPLLPTGEYDPICTARSAAEAKRLLLQRDFDLVIINSPLPDGPGIEFAEDLCAKTEAGVLLMVRDEVCAQVAAQVQKCGVMTLHKPSSRALAELAVHALCAVRERLRQRSGRQATVEEKIRELQLIDRAKWALIEQRHLTEPEAHRALERLAMEKGITKRQAAEEVIAGRA